jgi:hypothetical protein
MKIAIRVNSDRQIMSHRHPDDQQVAEAQSGRWVTIDSDDIGPIPDLPPYQTPSDGERRILTTGLVGTLCDSDTVLQDEDDEQRTSLDEAEPDEGPFPEVYLTYMGRVTDVEPTEPPSHTESRAVYEAWAIASDGGAQTQAWVDEGSGLTAGQAKGRILLSCLQHGAILTTGQHGLVAQFEAFAEPIELLSGGAVGMSGGH